MPVMTGETRDADHVVITTQGRQVTVRELWTRVEIVEPNIVSMHELAGSTPESLEVLTDRVLELAADAPRFAIVVRLGAVTGSPSAEYRRFIPAHWKRVHAAAAGRLVLVAVAFSGSPVARVISKFLIARMTSVPFAIEKDLEHAIAASRSALARPS